MTIAKSVAQGLFEIEYENIFAKRNHEAGLMVWVDGLSAISTSLVIMDVFGLLGFKMVAAFTFSSAAVAFFIPVIIAFGCAVVCSIFIVSDSRYRRDAELALMNECADLVKEQAPYLKALTGRIEKLLETKFLNEAEDAFIRERYQIIMQNKGDDLSNVLLEISDCLNAKRERSLKHKSLPQEPAKNEQNNVSIQPPLYKLAKFIAYFSGLGFMWGISASVCGGAAVSMALLTPLGIGALALAIIVGVASYIDYRCRLDQQEQTDALTSEKAVLTATNDHIKLAFDNVSYTIKAADDNKQLIELRTKVDALEERLRSPRQLGIYGSTRSVNDIVLNKDEALLENHSRVVSLSISQ